jgi:hypothetical protein
MFSTLLTDGVVLVSTKRYRTAVTIGAALFVAYAYFYQAGGWNQNSRFALVRAIVEQGTLQIDDTVHFDGRLITGDLSQFENHFYSDKAPGLALLAVPPVALMYPFLTAPQSPTGIATLSYIATVLTAALPTVFTALMILYLSKKLGASRRAAAFSAIVFGLGTPAWCYATLFYGHALTTACLTGAFGAAVALTDPSSQRRDWLLASAVGLGGGWATLTEYPSAVPAAMTALLAVAIASRDGAARAGRVAAGVAVNACLCIAILAWYNNASFGSPLRIGYLDEVGFEGLQEGFFGISSLNRDVLHELLFGRFRGLLPLAPVLAAAPIGFVLFIRDRRSRLPGLTAAAIATFYIIFNASYIYWDGGWSYGPRHIAPALPFMSLALAPIWSLVKPFFRVILVVMGLYGGGLTLVAVSTTAQPPDTYLRPVTELLWPNFVKGQLAINFQSYVERLPRDERDRSSHAWNVGEKLGLRGLTSLMPLAAAWCTTGLIWWTWRRSAAKRARRSHDRRGTSR